MEGQPLGAKVPAAAISDPTLDSQDRIYGVSFTLSGVLLLLCASDIPRFATVLHCVLWVFSPPGSRGWSPSRSTGFRPPPLWRCSSSS
jgi:hypothetical protein